MTSCIFCRIVAGEVSSHSVAVGDEAIAFLDVFPHAPGHTVVIPRRHHVTIETLSASEIQEVFLVVQKVVARLTDVLSPEGFTIGWNHGEVAGQAVPHLHVHVLPRYANDGGGSIHSVVNNRGAVSVAELAKRFD